MAKRITAKQKEEIKWNFINGESVNSLSKKFNFSKVTISRNLKDIIGEEKYKTLSKLNNKSETSSKKKVNQSNIVAHSAKTVSSDKENTNNYSRNHSFFIDQEFVEISPLNIEIDASRQKDITSIPLESVTFPKNVYMIINKYTELEIKPLRDFPKWNFLSSEDLNRQTIQIFVELKEAKRFCTKEEKVIKIPNPNVFQIVSPILNSRGITRIIFDDKLIAI